MAAAAAAAEAAAAAAAGGQVNRRPARAVAAHAVQLSAAAHVEANSCKLWRAVACGRLNEAQHLLELLAVGGPVHTRAKMGVSKSPILMAAITRPLVDRGLGPSVYATVEKLLLAGADLTSTDRSGNTVMHAAATGKRTGEWNHPDWRAKLRTHTSSEHLVSLLLFHGGDASARGSWGETPLFSAFSSEVAAVLVEAGADVNARSDGGRTPLHSSITSIRTRDVFEYILPLVDNIDAVDCNGFTPLHNAASCNNVFAVRALLQRGANMHLRSVAMELWPRPVLAVECIRVNFKEDGTEREDTRELRDLFAEETHRRGCCEAFAMGLRPRLRAGSVVRTLDDEVIRMVLSCAGMLHSVCAF
jgi:hypothetical protein